MLNKYSKLYNSDLGSAITRRGREYISHCALTSEGVLYGYFPKRYDALVYTIDQIKKEDNKYLYILKNEINKEIEKESENKKLLANDKIRYMVPKVLKHLDIDEDYYMYDAIEDRLMREDFDTLIKIYYKNNVKEFLAIPKVKSLFRDSIKSMNKTKKRISKIKDVEDGFLILEDGFETELKEGVKYTVSDLEDLSETELNVYNSMEVDGNKISLENLEVNEDLIGQYLIDESSVFINPYEPPEDIIENIDTISSMVKDILFGNYWYGGDYIQEKDLRTDNQQETIKNINRMAIMLIDTDSYLIGAYNRNIVM